MVSFTRGKRSARSGKVPVTKICQYPGTANSDQFFQFPSVEGAWSECYSCGYPQYTMELQPSTPGDRGTVMDELTCQDCSSTRPPALVLRPPGTSHYTSPHAYAYPNPQALPALQAIVIA